ncbi:hypothetical protein NA56DRAFT_580857, partial [Hyaloscypha hepaticicola]
SIIKEKFSIKEWANFDLEKDIKENIKDKLDLITLAELNNYTFYTFNYIYTSIIIFILNTLLYWDYRVSESWYILFRFNYILQGKRPRDVSEILSLRILNVSKRGQMCRKGAYSTTDLLTVTCKLYNIPDIQLRVPGQWDGLLVVIGPHPAEQVVLVIGTGSGKSLIFIVSVSVIDTRTMILILPIVILRGNILRHYHLIGIRSLIWSVNIK